MPWQSHKLDSVEGLAQLLLSFCARGGFGRWLWRGEPESHDSMFPKLCRGVDWAENCEGCILSREREELAKFTNLADSLLRVEELLPILPGLNQPSLVALEFAQHFGCSTRLVDWTWSPWVALFFSCWKTTGSGRIYWFDLTELERSLALQSGELKTFVFSYRNSKAAALDKMLFREGNSPWVAVHQPTRTFDRVLAQQGVFTVASRLDVDHRRVLGDLLPSGSAFCLDIPDSAFKVGILGMLRQMNVHADSLRFPALDYLMSR